MYFDQQQFHEGTLHIGGGKVYNHDVFKFLLCTIPGNYLAIALV